MTISPKTNANGNSRIAPADPTSWETFDLRPLLPDGGGNCLDLGCGPGARRDLSARGFHYTGLDYAPTSGADLRGDAQRLPFAAESFDLIVAASSFEHFPDPWAAAREAARVLRPGGHLIASLSFLEPYHARSHFHMSHLGASKLFSDSGLEIETIEPFEWTGPEAAAQALFQIRIARWLAYLIVRPVLFARKLGISILIRHVFKGNKRNRAREFLDEEKFRFTAGIKIKAVKPMTGDTD